MSSSENDNFLDRMYLHLDENERLLSLIVFFFNLWKCSYGCKGYGGFKPVFPDIPYQISSHASYFK